MVRQSVAPARTLPSGRLHAPSCAPVGVIVGPEMVPSPAGLQGGVTPLWCAEREGGIRCVDHVPFTPPPSPNFCRPPPFLSPSRIKQPCGLSFLPRVYLREFTDAA
jgi:hypothetical protein